MTRAEEAALKAYPIEICGYETECKIGAKPKPQDWNEERRKCFQEGYEQAEKDLINRIRKQVETWMPEKTVKNILTGNDLLFARYCIY